MRLFKLFKRKKKEERKLGWNDLTLTDLMQIKSISDLQLATEDEKNLWAFWYRYCQQAVT